MACVTIRPYRPSDALDVARDLRRADRDEIYAASGELVASRVIAAGAETSFSPVTGVIDGRPACVFGVAPGPGFCVPWLLGTGAIDGIPLFFVRSGRRIARHWAQRHGRLVNHVDARNVRAVRALALMGFTVAAPRPFGPFGMAFHRFTMDPVPETADV